MCYPNLVFDPMTFTVISHSLDNGGKQQEQCALVINVDMFRPVQQPVNNKETFIICFS